MTHYAAHIDLTRPTFDEAMTIFEGETEDAALEALSTALGGHPAISPATWSRSRT